MSDSACRELRLAVVMTGGVSLSVWMGGVAQQLFLATKGDGVFGDLAELTATDVTIDVITGASAGGLNGALLGVAVACDIAPSTFDELRALWLSAGSFENLLRAPFTKDPPSLLQGDGYFMPQVRDVLTRWINARGQQPIDQRDALTLVLTASLLSPERKSHSDDFGTTIVEPVHAATFTFTGDDFIGTRNAVAERTLASKLALAARTSASFPGAFEASFVPVGATGADDRPDMNGNASFSRSHWAVDGGVLMNKPIRPALDAIAARSSDSELRRVLVYVNPDPGEIAFAIDLESEAPTLSDVLTKSVLTLPRSESVATELTELLAHNATVVDHRRFRDALLKGVDIAESGAHTPATSTDGTEARTRRPLDYEQLADSLYPFWVKQRSALAVGARLEGYFASSGIGPLEPVAGGGLTFQELRVALEQARGDLRWLPSELPARPGSGDPDAAQGGDQPIDLAAPDAMWRWGFHPLEYISDLALDLIMRTYALLPLEDPSRAAELDRVRVALGETRNLVHEQRQVLRVMRESDDDYWAAALGEVHMGADACATRLAHALYAEWPLPPADLAKSATATSEGARVEHSGRVWQRRRHLWRELLLVAEMGAAFDDRTWRANVTAGMTPALLDQPPHPDDAEQVADALRQELRKAELRVAFSLTQQVAALRELFVDAARIHRLRDRRDNTDDATPAAAPARADDCPPPRVRLEVDVLEQVFAGLQPEGAAAPPAPVDGPDDVAMLRRLLCLYVVHTTTRHYASASPTRTELLQLSAFAPNMLDTTRDRPDQKVAGLQLGHFGAFVKESWRANDWMWGGLDAAYKVVTVLVDPIRFRQRFGSSAEAVGALGEIACGRSNQVRAALDTDNPHAADDVQFLTTAWQLSLTDVRAELAYLDARSDRPPPRTLPATVRALGFVAQLLIARQQLPTVAFAVDASTRNGADTTTDAWKFVELVKRAQMNTTSLRLRDTAELLTACRVGQEKVADELSSERGAATLSTAFAVATGAASGSNSGIGLLRGPAKLARTGALGMHLTANSAAKKTKAGFSFSIVLIAIAASTLAARLLGADIPSPVVVFAFLLSAVWLLYTSYSARAWPVFIVGPLTLVVIALAFIEPEAACGVFASSCDPNVDPPGWKDPMQWIVPMTLLIMAGVFVWTWFTQRARHRAAVSLSELANYPPPPAQSRSLLWLAAVLCVVAAVYGFWLHDFLFTGVGDEGFRATWIGWVEALGNNRAIFTLIVLPAAAVLMTYLIDQHRRRRAANRRRAALDQLLELP